MNILIFAHRILTEHVDGQTYTMIRVTQIHEFDEPSMIVMTSAAITPAVASRRIYLPASRHEHAPRRFDVTTDSWDVSHVCDRDVFEVNRLPDLPLNHWLALARYKPERLQ